MRGGHFNGGVIDGFIDDLLGGTNIDEMCLRDTRGKKEAVKLHPGSCVLNDYWAQHRRSHAEGTSQNVPHRKSHN